MITATTDADWREFRRQGIGGSDIGALVGLSRYASPTSIYYDKRGQLDDRHDTPRLRIGRRMETVLGEEFHDRTGLYVDAQQTLWVHPEHDFARCTVDGFATEGPDVGDEPLGTVQFKTDARYGWDTVPAAIRGQCVWEMGVTGLGHCWLVVMFGGFRVDVIEIPFDEEARADWDYMLTAARAFWLDHVVPGIPPPIDDSDATTKALTAVYEPHPNDMKIADRDALDLFHGAALARQRYDAAKANRDKWDNELRDLLGECTELVDDRGRLLASWRPQTAQRLDTQALRDAHPALVATFTRPVDSRVLRLHTKDVTDADE